MRLRSTTTETTTTTTTKTTICSENRLWDYNGAHKTRVKDTKRKRIMKMKQIKLDYRQIDAKNSLKRRLCAFNLNKMFKIENWTILLFLVLAHEIQGTYSQGKKNFD